MRTFLSALILAAACLAIGPHARPVADPPPAFVPFPAAAGPAAGRFGIPHAVTLPRERYTAVYDGRTRTPAYVIEFLDSSLAATRSGARHPLRRSPWSAAAVPPEFRSTPADYAAAARTYDAGHCCPFADCPTPSSARESFGLHNAAPQNCALNRGLWARLEKNLRLLAAQEGTELWIITAPLWIPDDSGTLTIRTAGPNHVWIPTHWSKAALLQQADGTRHMAAWIIPNAPPPANATLDAFRVTVDAIESAAGADYFAELPPEEQAALETAR